MEKLSKILLEDPNFGDIEVDAKYVKDLVFLNIKEVLCFDKENRGFDKNHTTEYARIELSYNKDDKEEEKEFNKLSKKIIKLDDFWRITLFYDNGEPKKIDLPWYDEDNITNFFESMWFNSYEDLTINDDEIRMVFNEKAKIKDFNIVGRISKKDSGLPVNLFILESCDNSTFAGSLKYSMYDVIHYFARFQDNPNDAFGDNNFVKLNSLVDKDRWYSFNPFEQKYHKYFKDWINDIVTYTSHNLFAIKALANKLIDFDEYLKLANKYDEITGKKNLKDIKLETIKVLEKHNSDNFDNNLNKVKLYNRFLKEESNNMSEE